MIIAQFIAVSTVIGVTIFSSDGKALAVAGPSGALLAFAIVGIVAICVMECVSELIQMFPTPNAIVKFIQVFVDEDLAWVIGIGYWYGSLSQHFWHSGVVFDNNRYTWATIFPTLIISAADFTDYWDLPQVYQTVVFYIFAALVMLAINCAGVFVSSLSRKSNVLKLTIPRLLAGLRQSEASLRYLWCSLGGL